MAVVGFNFTKMNAERKKPFMGKINIANNVAITSVDEHTLNFGKEKQGGLKFTFEFTSKYEPAIGSILIEGEVIYMNEPSKVKQAIDEWKKSKKVSKEIMTEILNNVLDRTNIQALVLSKDMNMPPPVPLPKVQEQVKK